MLNREKVALLQLVIVASGDYFSTYGGGQVYVRSLVKGLLQQGQAVSVVSVVIQPGLTEPVVDRREAAGASIWQLIVPPPSAVDISEELQPELLQALEQVLRQIGPSVVHAHGWKSATATVCRRLAIPCIVTAHHGGIICPNGTLMTRQDEICTVPVSMEHCLSCTLHFVPAGDLWAPLVCRTPEDVGMPVARWLRSRRNIPYVSPAWQAPLGIRHKQRQNAVLSEAPTRLIAPSRAMAAALARNGVPAEKLTVLPHGIEPLPRTPLMPGWPGRPLRLGYVGRLAYIKGLHVLIEALRGLPRAAYDLHIHGEAANRTEQRYAASLRRQAAGLPITWQGKLAYDDLPHAYAKLDVLLLPSICLEVFGLTVVEAHSAGRPVIATRCGGPEDTVRHGVDGLLVAPNDASALRDALRALLDDSTLLPALAREAGPVTTLTAHVDALLALYCSIASTPAEVHP